MTIRLLWVANPSDRTESAVRAIERELPTATVTVASTEREAMTTVGAESIDCVISDHDPPAIDAVDLVERLDRLRSAPPVVVFPREGSETLASRVIRVGGGDYVRPEEGTATLARRVERAIESAPDRSDCRSFLDGLGDDVAVFDAADIEPRAVDRWLCGFLEHRYGEGTCEACERAASDAARGNVPGDGDDGGDADRAGQHDGGSVGSEGSIGFWCDCRGDWARTTDTEALIERALDSGAASAEWSCEAIDGEQFWVDVSLDSVGDHGRERVVAVARDVTETKRRERRLRAYREAVEHAGHSIYVTDADGRIEWVNPAFERMTGYSADEAVGRTPTFLRSGAHDEAFYERLWGTILAGEVWNDRIVNRRADGETFVVNQTISPITSEDGEIDRFVAINADVTERQRRERQLRKLHDAVRGWLDITSSETIAERACQHLLSITNLELTGVLLFDGSANELQLVARSPRAGELFETELSFTEGDGIIWRVFETGEPAFYDDVREAPDVYNPETPIRSEMVVPLSDHGVVVVGSETVGEFDDWDRSLAGIVASNLEATFDRLERERRLAEQNRRLEQVTRVISHDLRNPLAIASGSAEQTRRSGELAHLDDVERALDRMETIVDELLFLARDGADIGELAPVSVAAVARDAWELVETSEATLTVELDGTGPSADGVHRVLADRNRLQQLFENLFRNSVEHGGRDVTVRVGAVEDGYYVEDDGPGIQPANRSRVFESGFSAEDDGTGLGLAIVETVVDAHDWSIDLTAADSGGARFEIRTRFD